MHHSRRSELVADTRLAYHVVMWAGDLRVSEEFINLVTSNAASSYPSWWRIETGRGERTLGPLLEVCIDCFVERSGLHGRNGRSRRPPGLRVRAAR